MQQYLDLMKDVLENGIDHSDRTKVGRRSVFGRQVRYSMDTFPLVTTRHISFKNALVEMLWYISGSSSIKPLLEQNVNYWNNWAVTLSDVDDFVVKYGNKFNENTDNVKEYFNESVDSIGPLYGSMWRSAPPMSSPYLSPKINMEDIPPNTLAAIEEEYDKYTKVTQIQNIEPLTKEDFASCFYYKTVDQLNDLIINLRDRPYSSRHVVTAWVPGAVAFETVSPQENVLMGRGALAPCHMFFQCFVHPPKDESEKPKLSLLMYQRSADLAIGVPTNVACYGILLHMLAHVSNMEPYELIHSLGDCHLYLDQIEGAKEQITRQCYPGPTLTLNPKITSIYDFTVNDFKLSGYEHHPVIKFPLAT